MIVVPCDYLFIYPIWWAIRACQLYRFTYLEAVLMDLYIIFFLFSFFLAFGGKSAQIGVSRPLGELLGPNLGVRRGSPKCWTFPSVSTQHMKIGGLSWINDPFEVSNLVSGTPRGGVGSSSKYVVEMCTKLRPLKVLTLNMQKCT